MMFWQLTIDANDPAVLARFWAQALDYQPSPPAEPQTTWQAHYRARLGQDAAFADRLFDPAGLRPPIWFQHVPEAKAGKNRLHLDLYPSGRDSALPVQQRIEIVEAKVAELIRLGASVQRRTRHDDPEDPDLPRAHARPGRQRVLRQLRLTAGRGIRDVGCRPASARPTYQGQFRRIADRADRA